MIFPACSCPSLGKKQELPIVDDRPDPGYPDSALRLIAILQLICWVTYLVPRTSVLGAVLWTGYLGGAVATHVRLENPIFSHVLFPVYVAALLWGGLWLRDPRVRALVPLMSARRSARDAHEVGATKR